MDRFQDNLPIYFISIMMAVLIILQIGTFQAIGEMRKHMSFMMAQMENAERAADSAKNAAERAQSDVADLRYR